METIDLSSGMSYFRSPEPATEAAIAALRNGQTRYGPTEGSEALRKAIAHKYKHYGVDVSPAQVLITPGTKQALYNLFTVLLREQDEIVIPTPAWFGFDSLIRYSKGIYVALETFFSNGYAIIPEVLEDVITEKTRILLLTNPGNPTGRLYSKEELEAILKVTAKYPELYIISDEIYDLDTYGSPFTSILSCKGAAPERTIVVNGFSKTFAMSGWRIGYIVGPPDLIDTCIDFQNSTISGVSLFVQEAALSALEHEDKALEPMLTVLAEHRLLMQQGLDTIPHVRYYLPDGAYYFFPDLSFYLNTITPAGQEIRTSVDLCIFLQEHYQLQLAPGDHFGSPGHVRMSFAVEKPVLKAGLERLRRALLSLYKPD